MKLIERLRIYIEHKGISYNSFDKSIGASNGYIGKQLKNNASIGSDIIEKISETYKDLNIEWLITGSGDMIVDSKMTQLHEPEIIYNKAQTICKLCQEKDKRIADLQNQIQTLTNILNSLTDNESNKKS